MEEKWYSTVYLLICEQASVKHLNAYANANANANGFSKFNSCTNVSIISKLGQENR